MGFASVSSAAFCPGVQLRAIAVLQCVIVASVSDLRRSLRECAQQGFIGSMPLADARVQYDLSYGVDFWKRESAFWCVFSALAVAALGDVVSRFRAATQEELPMAFALCWTALCLLGAGMMPNSPFWLGFLNGLWMIRLAYYPLESSESPTPKATKNSAKIQIGREVSTDQDADMSNKETEYAGMTISDAESGLESLRGASEMEKRLKSIACTIVLTAAYAFLVPGLVTTLFTAHAEVGGITYVDIEKSTTGLVWMLFDAGNWIPALLILVYSVLMPFAKLTVLVGYAYLALLGRSRPDSFFASASGVATVQKISKWATIDCFTTATICGFFCEQDLLKIVLHDGFYYFMSYCVLSVTGALLIELPRETRPAHRKLLAPGAAQQPEKLVLLGAALSSAGVLAVLATLISMPIMRVEFGQVYLDASLSIVGVVGQLWTKGFSAAAVCLFALVVVVPAMDLVSTVLETFELASSLPARRWLRDFAMLDVFGLAVAITVATVSALHNDIHATLLPAGWALCLTSAILVYFAWAGASPTEEASR
ncbi:unnamed protein product [Polarella glacialis]|nr:unnamed protein product [Polarella glacialis]